MSITAKELAEKLNLSQTAVSMALNNKPGVSTETRRMVVEAAEKYGYDFTRLSLKKNKAGSIYAVSYRSHNAIMSYSPIFDAMVEGMESVVQKDNYKLKVITFYEKRDNLEHYLGDLRTTDCVGIILFGTEMREEMVRPFLKLPFPVVILDAYFENLDCNYVVPNNRQGAYLATDYLISRRMKQPGYLQSAYPLRNFSERLEGFYHAVHDNGMSRSRCIIHQLSPTIDGAMADMLAIIDRGDALADCYFADNDLKLSSKLIKQGLTWKIYTPSVRWECNISIVNNICNIFILFRHLSLNSASIAGSANICISKCLLNFNGSQCC